MQEVMQKVISIKYVLLIHLPLSARTCQMKVKLKQSLRYYFSDVSCSNAPSDYLDKKGLKEI